MTEAESTVVLINVFRCEPERQEALLDLLSVLTRAQRALPGFISAVLHRGLDGRHVANYALWESVADWKAMTRHPTIAAAMSPILTIATFEPHLYDAGEVID